MAFRGDMNAILNRLVREGVLASFQTNFDGRSSSLGIHIIVIGSAGRGAKEVRTAVTAALSPILQQEPVTITVARRPPSV